MSVVWKFELRPWSAFIDMPRGARIIHVGAQGDTACVWALCEPRRPKEPRYVVAVPTGEEVPRHAITFVGTFVIDDGLVFHVFEGEAVTRDGVTTTVQSSEQTANALQNAPSEQTPRSEEE